ncbi:hypothetical protein MTR67_007018 [Solanum verrucosum]|uniref:Tf2-1-like SH3-like domain-containing protein n=1 Tax=Solanum verrucosum TaxID=315347 RepID=A0AAF0PYY6_SOLVR|nr:hypothetical protein MTR67_007018 [Solanum verrucosum]
MEKVGVIQDRLKTAQSRQKSYTDVRRRDLEFEVDDWVYRKVSPVNGVMRFGKKGKLSPRYIGPYRISKRIGNVACELELPQELATVHPVFHISMLEKCMGDLSLIIPAEVIGRMFLMGPPSLVSNPRDEMSHFVTGVSDPVEEECRTAMLYDDMNISRLMVYAQSIEESKLKRRNRELKTGRSDEQGQPRLKKRSPNQDSSSTPKVNQERCGGPSFSIPTCTTCGKKHFGKCLAGTNGCYGCGKNDPQLRNCPTLAAKEREAKQASPNVPDPYATKNSCFYVLQTRYDKEDLPDESTDK